MQETISAYIFKNAEGIEELPKHIRTMRELKEEVRENQRSLLA